MKNEHLTEETLQAFLLKETQEDGIATHLLACENCRARFENYQHLVAEIQKIAPETFSFDVTTVVMDKIVSYERKESSKQELILWGVLILLLLVILGFSLPFVPQIFSIFSAMPLFSNFLLFGTSIFVLVFLIADIYKAHKIEEKKIFGNNLQPTIHLPVQ